MFEGSLWRGRSHAMRIVYFLIAPILIIMLVAFLLAYFHYAVIGTVLVCVGVACDVVALCVLNKKIKWYNKNLVFAFDGFGVYFGMTNVSNSYFYDNFTNVESYDYKELKNDLATITLNLKNPSNAGSFGNLRQIVMVKVDNYGRALDILNEHGIPRVRGKIKINTDNSI